MAQLGQHTKNWVLARQAGEHTMFASAHSLTHSPLTCCCRLLPPQLHSCAACWVPLDLMDIHRRSQHRSCSSAHSHPLPHHLTHPHSRPTPAPTHTPGTPAPPHLPAQLDAHLLAHARRHAHGCHAAGLGAPHLAQFGVPRLMQVLGHLVGGVGGTGRQAGRQAGRGGSHYHKARCCLQ
jgi:hypothetical protein